MLSQDAALGVPLDCEIHFIVHVHVVVTTQTRLVGQFPIVCAAGMAYLHYQAPDAPIRHNNLCSGKSTSMDWHCGQCFSNIDLKLFDFGLQYFSNAEVIKEYPRSVQD